MNKGDNKTVRRLRRKVLQLQDNVKYLHGSLQMKEKKIDLLEGDVKSLKEELDNEQGEESTTGGVGAGLGGTSGGTSTGLGVENGEDSGNESTPSGIS